MATIRPADLPASAGVSADDAFVVDTGAAVERATAAQIVDAAIPLASQADAEAGTDNAKRVTPLRVKQAIEALGVSAENLASTATGKGAAMVGFLQSGTGTVARTAQDKMRDAMSAYDFGPALSAASLMLATGAADTYSSSLWRSIEIPNGVHTVSDQIFLRRGQDLVGKGPGGSTFDFTGQIAAVLPAIVMGKNSAGVADAGGQGSSVQNLTLKGGPATAAVVSTAGSDGQRISGNFFSGPGLGVDLAGTDGDCHDNIFDIGVTHCKLSNKNNRFRGNHHYQGNIHYTVETGAKDGVIENAHSEYAAYYGVLLNTGATGIRNLAIRNSTFLMSTQTATMEGAIVDRATGAQFTVENISVFNIYGAAVKTVDATGVCDIRGLTADGLKTDVTYAQSTTMAGVDFNAISRGTLKNSTLRNLPGQPVTVGGGSAQVFVLIDGVDFSGNTGGSAEIAVTNTNSASTVIIRGCTGDGRSLYTTAGAKVIVVPGTCVGFDAGAVASATTVTLPQTRDVFQVSGTTNVTGITANAGNAGRRVTLIFQGALTFTDGSNLKLAGNLVTTADDAITIATDDGLTWYETARSVN